MRTVYENRIVIGDSDRSAKASSARNVALSGSARIRFFGKRPQTWVGKDLVVPTVDHGGPLKMGILSKRAVSSRMAGPWRTRRIRLMPTAIEWGTLHDMMKGQLELTISTPRRYTGPTTLQISTGQRTLVLCAPDPSQCAEWYAAIGLALASLRKSALQSLDRRSDLRKATERER